MNFIEQATQHGCSFFVKYLTIGTDDKKYQKLLGRILRKHQTYYFEVQIFSVLLVKDFPYL